MMFAKPISLVLGAAALAAAAPTRRSTCSQPAGSKQYSCDDVWHPTDNSGWKFKVDEWQGTEPGVFADTNVAWTDGAMEMSVLDKGADWHDPSVSDTCDCGYKQYSTALAVSEETYGYGYYEAKIQGGTPYHLGFWLQGDGLEINVVEFSQDKFYSNYHCFSSTDETGEDTKSGEAQDYAAPGAGEWVTYGVEYTAAALKFYRNGVLHDTASPECLGGVADKLNVGFTHETNPDFGDIATGDAKVAIKDFMYWTDADADVAQGTTTDQPTTATESAFVPTCGQTVAGDDDSAYACSADADEMYNPAESEATTVDAATCCKALADKNTKACGRLVNEGAQAVKLACDPATSDADMQAKQLICKKTCKDYLAFDLTCGQTELQKTDSPHKCSAGVYDATKAAATTVNDQTCCKPLDEDTDPSFCQGKVHALTTVDKKQAACSTDAAIQKRCAKSCSDISLLADGDGQYCEGKVQTKPTAEAKAQCLLNGPIKKCVKTCTDFKAFVPTCGKTELYNADPSKAPTESKSPYKCPGGFVYDSSNAEDTTVEVSTCCKELVDTHLDYCAANLYALATTDKKVAACSANAIVAKRCGKTCLEASLEEDTYPNFCQGKVQRVPVAEAKANCDGVADPTILKRCEKSCADALNFIPTCGQLEVYNFDPSKAPVEAASPHTCQPGYKLDAAKAAETTIDDATCCKELVDLSKSYCEGKFKGAALTNAKTKSTALRACVEVCECKNGQQYCKVEDKCAKSCSQAVVDYKGLKWCSKKLSTPEKLASECQKNSIKRKCGAMCKDTVRKFKGLDAATICSQR